MKQEVLQQKLRMSCCWHHRRWRAAAHRSLSRHCLRLLLLSRNHDTDIINNSIMGLRVFSMVLETANETADESWRTRFSFMPSRHFPFTSKTGFLQVFIT